MKGAALYGFRARLLAIVAATAFAFVLLVAASALLAVQVTDQLGVIQRNYLPKLELAPRLDGQFEHLRRSLQDAVAAQDLEALAATRAEKDSLLGVIESSRPSVDSARIASTRAAVESYYAAASGVSRRMIAGETGEGMVDAVGSMQAKQKDVSERLKQVAQFNPHELTAAFNVAADAQRTANRLRLSISVACLALVLSLSLWFSRGVLRAIDELREGLGRFGKGDFERPIEVTRADELGRLAEQANSMAASLQRLNAERDRHDWLKNGHSELARELRGELEPGELAARATRCLARYVDAPAAALYSNDEQGLHLLGHYAAALPAGEQSAAPHFRVGEGLVGQAALQQDALVVTDLPPDHLKIRSGLGTSSPLAIVLLPLVHAGRVSGVLEIALLRAWTPLHAELLAGVRDTLAIALEVARARATSRALLRETQQQAQRLAAQEEELRAANEELQSQQKELHETNDELRQQTEELEEQRRALELNNRDLHEARTSLEHKAEELVTVSAYKSQFLANMSHELRTPLNSMLLLSNLLSENESGNLSDKQVEYCRTIHGAGRDLLLLINQVLDLAKIESGKQEIHVEPVSLSDLSDYAARIFAPLAQAKGLDFRIEIAPGLPLTITNDPRRIEQILNNLLGNAIKFTEHGSVTLQITAPAPGALLRRENLRARECVALTVVDTGIGIRPELQERIFAPFEQAEAATDRRYGGTGLGLTIAREIAGLLGGELHVQSEPGRGTAFTCYLPFAWSGALEEAVAVDRIDAAPAHRAARADRRREHTTPANGSVQLLVVEDDPAFARAIDEVVSGLGLTALVTSRGRAALELARQYKPAGIILDVRLPDIDGFAVMDALRADPHTADIPVHFISALEGRDRGLAMGAVGYLTKPASRGDLVRVVEALVPKAQDDHVRVLIIEDDVCVADSLVERLRTEAIDARRMTSAHDALQALAAEHFSCLVLDLSLPDMDGLEFLQQLAARHDDAPPVVIYTGRALSKTETQRLEAYAHAVVLKEGPSIDRLVDEVRLFARRVKQGLPTRGVISSAPEPAQMRLDGRKILVVDDDMRTVYAMCALLRAKGATVLTADTGRAALDELAAHPEIEAVLMDIMMPEMDGYEAMRRIRSEARFARLPIIALTAKAMKLDREKCLEAGATDYLPKPLDARLLLERLHGHVMERGHAK